MPVSLSPVPGMSNLVGVSGNNRYMRMYNNPFFDYLTQQLPRNHQEMFRWCELMYFSAPVIVNAVKKLTSYPVTSFQFVSDSEKVREDTEKFVDSIKLLDHLLEVGLNYYVYGNYFSSVYFPFTRMLVCESCKSDFNIASMDYKLTRNKFKYECPGCKKHTTGTLKDIPYRKPADVKLVTWDAKQIELIKNPITSACEYYYRLPKTIETGIMNSTPTIVNTLPSIYLDAFFMRRQVQFTSNFYHMKTPSVSGHASGWGISPLMPALKIFLYSAILRKSVEAIGLEHITPRRILYPEATTTDPTIGSNLIQWRQMITRGLEMWREDPNYVLVAPYPTGMVNIGGTGATNMPSNEIKEAEQDMLRAVDVPVELVYGATSVNNTPVALRMLENQLRPLTTCYENYANWVIDRVNAKYNLEYCHVTLTPFKLMDDVMQKQLLLQSVGNFAAASTAMEALGLSPDKEKDKLKEEAVEALQNQKDLENEQKKIEQDISTQVTQDAEAEVNGTVPEYQQQKMIAQAEMTAQELLSMPQGPRASALAQLQNEDFVMHAVVRQIMQTMQNRGEDPHSAQAYAEGRGAEA